MLQYFTLHFRYQIIRMYILQQKCILLYSSNTHACLSGLFSLSKPSKYSLFTSQSHVTSFIKPKIIVKLNLIYSQNVSKLYTTHAQKHTPCVTSIRYHPRKITNHPHKYLVDYYLQWWECCKYTYICREFLAIRKCVLSPYKKMFDDVWYDINFGTFNSCRWTFNSIGCKFCELPEKRKDFWLCCILKYT